ncbi:SPOR domain-containing protein [Sedimentitalea sp. JM2-8]|uniref:SPOR domain-containing protein n=1 Tax=Sedimentitalea xiamensis TaxID=3050037 RepID=A0ABT7FF90_9RHOB|nr:SPOR domain-containing protein [Sedimentitalea xiamensis]MDK3073795.1 SPOR domain-containing protein [Sedimentitalea xiamensis]
MIRNSTGLRRLSSLTAMAAVLGLLAACEDGTGFLKPSDTDDSAVAGTGKKARQTGDGVEAPDVFQVTEAALWDGRPSLGGVWVAHPDVTDPQRVIIRNTANDTSVIGALFRRERDIPGPRIQVSSDAAEALSMLAGAPVQLNVTALVREPAEPDVENAISAEETPSAEETEPHRTAATAPIATSVEAGETATPAEIASETPEPARKNGFRWPWAKPKPAETAPLATTAGVTGAATVVASELPPAAASDLDQPFIQVGIFGQEDNADRAATKIRNAGMTPTVYERESGGKTFWRVLVGPSRTEAEQASLLNKVRETGFPDAYTVTN